MKKIIITALKIIIFLVIWVIQMTILIYFTMEFYGELRPNPSIAIGGLTSLYLSYIFVKKLNISKFLISFKRSHKKESTKIDTTELVVTEEASSSNERKEETNIREGNKTKRMSILKKRLAIEILTAIGVVVVSLLIYFILNNITQNLIEKDENFSQQIETLEWTSGVNYQNIENESLKKVWESFTNNLIYVGTYDDFLKDYGDYSYSEILYRLAINNGLFTKSLYDFRIKYFKSDQVIRDAYSLWERPAKSTNTRYYNFEYFYNNIISDKEFALVSYETFLKKGYKKSFEAFQKLILNESSIKIDPKISNEISTLIEGQQKLRNKILFDYRFKFYLIVDYMIIIFYSLRFLSLITVWSVKQLKP